jgi:catechol 2,3-dioxygenase-like lactoylglutathione lyase family enzyme
VSGWPGSIGALTLFVDDLEDAKRFYLEAFGLPVHFEDEDSVVFDFGNTLVNLLRTDAAAELIDPVPVGGPGSGPRYQLTVEIDDVDAVCEDLVARGVRLINGPIDRPWGPRTACFADPSGHIWEIAGN